MSKRVPARIDGIVASQANVAMIFRRGPRDWNRGYLWNFETDELTPGDWIQAKVFTEDCDLSSDGRYLITDLFNYGALGPLLEDGLQIPQPRGDFWTALSRAPRYAPLAIWHHAMRHGESGWWATRTGEPLSDADALAWRSLSRDDRRLASGWRVTQPLVDEIANVHDEEHRALMLAMDSPPYDGTSESFRSLQRWYFERMAESRPLRIVRHAEELTKPFPGGTLVRIRTREEVRWEARSDRGEVRLAFRPKPYQPQWLDLDHRGRVVFGDRGGLWVWEEFPRGRPRLFADLNEDRPDESMPLGWAI